MAITALKSSPARKLSPNPLPRLQRLPDPVLRLVAELRPSEGKSVTKVAFNSIIFGAMIFALVCVMGLNLALNPQNLARISSPESLAKKARLLGMVPSGNPDFLMLNQPKVNEVIIKDKGAKE